MCFQAGFEKGTIESLNMIVRCCCNVQDIPLVSKFLKIQVSIYLQYRQFDNAIRALERLKDIAEDTDDFDELVDIYQKISQCYLKTNKNNHALMSLQSMLQHAWFTKNQLAEIKAYSLLAIVYFNLADLKNSKYYH